MKKYGILEWCCFAIIVTMFFLLLGQVISRFVFDSPITWSEEISRLLLVWLSFIGAAAALKRDEHVRFTYLIDKLPPKLQKVIKVLNDGIVVVFFAVVVFYSIKITVSSWETPIVTVSWMNWSFFYAAVPTGFLVMIFLVVKRYVSKKASPPDNKDNKEV